jgi:penicillin-binding protein 1A
MSGSKAGKNTRGASNQRRPPSVEPQADDSAGQPNGPVAPRRNSPERKSRAKAEPSKPEKKPPVHTHAATADDSKAAPKPARRPRPKRARRSQSRWLATAARLTVGLAIWVLIAGAAAIGWFAWDLPRIDQVEVLRRHPSVTIIAGDGSTFARVGQLGGDAVQLGDLPPYVPQAIVAIEDRRFYLHPGIDPLGLLRAAWVNFRAGRVVQGGSTLTQQLAKNLFLTTDRTVRRKVQEALLAVWLDWTYDKDQLLEAYLNRVYLGGGAYGVNAAALRYFDKPAARLTLREAAVIAGLLKAPSRYAPSNDPDRARERADIVLVAMLDQDYITSAPAPSP